MSVVHFQWLENCCHFPDPNIDRVCVRACVCSCENLWVFKVNFKSGKNTSCPSPTSIYEREYNDKNSCQLTLETSLWSPCVPHSTQSINLEHVEMAGKTKSPTVRFSLLFSHSPFSMSASAFNSAIFVRTTNDKRNKSIQYCVVNLWSQKKNYKHSSHLSLRFKKNTKCVFFISLNSLVQILFTFNDLLRKKNCCNNSHWCLISTLFRYGTLLQTHVVKTNKKRRNTNGRYKNDINVNTNNNLHAENVRRRVFVWTNENWKHKFSMKFNCEVLHLSLLLWLLWCVYVRCCCFERCFNFFCVVLVLGCTDDGTEKNWFWMCCFFSRSRNV